MQKEKGIVLKVDGSQAIVMTPDRRFLRVPATSGTRIGQEMDINHQLTTNRFGWKKIGLAAASIALMAGLWQFTAYLQPGKVSAYVAVDINPSVELSVDKDKDVVEITPLNEDGTKLASQLNYKGKELDEVISDLTEQAAKQGYIKPDGEILVTASGAGKSTFDVEQLEKEAISSVETVLKQTGLAANVGGVLVSAEVRAEAKEKGLSPGKYALYLQAQARNIPVTIEELQRQSVSSIAVQHGKEVKEIVKKMNGKKLDQLLAELKEASPAKTADDKPNTDKPNSDKANPGNKDKKDDGHQGNGQDKKNPAIYGQPAINLNKYDNNYNNNGGHSSDDEDQDHDDDKDSKNDNGKRNGPPFLKKSGGEDDQGKESGNGDPGTDTPREMRSPSLPAIEVALSLNTDKEKEKEVFAKKNDKNSVETKQSSKKSTLLKPRRK